MPKEKVFIKEKKKIAILESRLKDLEDVKKEIEELKRLGVWCAQNGHEWSRLQYKKNKTKQIAKENERDKREEEVSMRYGDRSGYYRKELKVVKGEMLDLKMAVRDCEITLECIVCGKKRGIKWEDINEK